MNNKQPEPGDLDSSPDFEDEASKRRSQTARIIYQRYRSISSPIPASQRSPRSKGARVGDFGNAPTDRSGSTAGPASTPPNSAEDSRQEAPRKHSASWVAPPGIFRSKTGTGRSRWDPQPLKDVLSVELRRRGWDQTLSVASVTAQWGEIVGPHIAEHCPIESFEGGTLVARADSSAWAQQLQVLLPHIHKRIDERVGPGIVDTVVVRPPRAPSWTKGKRVYKGGRGPRDTYG